VNRVEPARTGADVSPTPRPAALVEARALSKRFAVRGTRRWLHAVDDVSFTIERGECVGLVGESGCGKSTLVRLLTRLIDPTAGRIVFDGREIGTVPSRAFASAPERARIQMVFQDPADSLNPRFTALDTIAEPLRRLVPASGGARRQRVEQVADLVGLPRELLGRFPHQLSGGQQQRVGIARAIAVEPTLLVLDEPTSALDVSVQAVILHLLADLRRRLGMTYLFVSHDLNLVRLMSDRVLVMYLGRIVEAGPVREVFDRPRHPYTRALVSAIPVLDQITEASPRSAERCSAPTAGGRGARIRLTGEPRSPIDPSPTVCRFHGRCPEGFDRCVQEMPLLRSTGPDHVAACHRLDEVTE
jgi:peptide/nickel transport system ATP-binding protein